MTNAFILTILVLYGKKLTEYTYYILAFRRLAVPCEL